MLIVSTLLSFRVFMTLCNINPDINPMNYPKEIQLFPSYPFTSIPYLKIDHEPQNNEYERAYYWTFISVGCHFQSLLADMLILLMLHIYTKTCYTLKFYRKIKFEQQKEAIVEKYTSSHSDNEYSKISEGEIYEEFAIISEESGNFYMFRKLEYFAIMHYSKFMILKNDS